jgi:hypothetical protein
LVNREESEMIKLLKIIPKTSIFLLIIFSLSSLLLEPGQTLAIEEPVFGVYDPCGVNPNPECDYENLYKALKEAGVEWVALGASQYLLRPKYLNYLYDLGFLVLGEIPSSFGLKFGERAYVDKMDLVKYSNRLKNYVSKYNFIEYWHVVEEADELQFWPDTPENYALFLRVTYKSIKEVNPKAKVVLGKCTDRKYGYTYEIPSPDIARRSVRSGFYLKVLEELRHLEEVERDPQKNNKYKDRPSINQEEYNLIFKPDSFKEYFDIVAVGRTLWRKEDIWSKEDIKVIEDALHSFGYAKKPLWAIDVGDHYRFIFNPLMAPVIGPIQSMEVPPEDEGARRLIKIYSQILSLGIDKIAYNGTFLNKDGTKRLEYFTHRLMAEKIRGFISAEKIAEGKYKFYFKDKPPLYILWNDSGSKDVEIDITTDNANKAIKTSPKLIPGIQITNFSGSFTREALTIKNGKLRITLTKDPIFVELMNPGYTSNK